MRTVVQADNFPIFGQIKITLDGIGLFLPSKAEGSECIFGCGMRGTAVGNDQLAIARDGE